jgi:hypothetical protein
VIARALLIGCIGMAVSMGAEPDVMQSVRAAADAALDTHPESAFWRGAGIAAISADRDGKPVAGHRAEVRSRWTPQYLYFLFTCPYEKLHLKPSPRADVETNQLWNWDVAEVFIGWDMQHPRRYREFEMSPQGEWVDLAIDLENKPEVYDIKWNSGFEVSARIDEQGKRWYGAMRIPWSSIDERRPAAGNTLRMNLFRAQGPTEERKYMAWQAPMRLSFHTPEKFGTLKLVE